MFGDDDEDLHHPHPPHHHHGGGDCFNPVYNLAHERGFRGRPDFQIPTLPL